MIQNYKPRGAVWTPHSIAELLVTWAVRSAHDSVLDLGCGEGVFLCETIRRLKNLGASSEQIAYQLLGTELDLDTFKKLQNKLEQALGRIPPYVYHNDFFKTEFPEKVEAIIGNPPYVRRWWLHNLDEIRYTISNTAKNFPRSTDLACYFVIHAIKFLKPGGRLALILSDSWLDMDYGENFKRFLLNHFHIHAIIGFEAKVFPNHLINTVLLLAEKLANTCQSNAQLRTTFLRWKTLPSPLDWDIVLSKGSPCASNILIKPQRDLKSTEPWSKLLYAPPAYFRLAKHPKLVPLQTLARTRIGFQSFCKRFYIIPAKSPWHIEPQYLKPLIYSPRDIAGPILTPSHSPKHFLLYCSKLPSELVGTHVLRYIKWGESQKITPRGRHQEVIGFHNSPRIQRANRQPWYNLVPELSRRGSWPVLLFRRLFKRYAVIWNQAGWIASENFIELQPRPGVDLLALLAFLNSSFAELLFQTHAHRYGGGVYNLNPGDIGGIPVLNILKLSENEKERLKAAYESFLLLGGRDRQVLDQVIANVLDLEISFIKDQRTKENLGVVI
ncbi:MAG: N-6 DNA methylase [Candidatus Caldarchaeum sp.]